MLTWKDIDGVIPYRVPVKAWIGDDLYLEDGAYKQIDNLARLPFAFHHIAIMPDCHQGYGMPIGGVLATDGVVIPNAVGVDIGCGMCAMKTSLKVNEIDKDTLKKIMGKIREVIPVGFEHHKEKQLEGDMPDLCDFRVKFGSNFVNSITAKEHESAMRQIGTLGGGNHFIEIQKGSDEGVWIMIHSGSRNIGKKVADYYNKLAAVLNKKWYSELIPNWELAFLPIESQEAKDYMDEMKYCVDFALSNRFLMMKRIVGVFQEVLGLPGGGKILGDYTFEAPRDNGIINIAHNYAAWENHFGKNVIVHRKGATLAREGTIGIIPGSQGSKSYIVRGKGNKESFESCSHGAGRKMGRNQACKTLDLATEQKRMDDQGIIHGLRNVKNLDEAAGAYKEIDVVMRNQAELVDIVETLQPLAVIKGD